MRAELVDPDARDKLRRGEVKDTAGTALKPRDQPAKLYGKLARCCALALNDV